MPRDTGNLRPLLAVCSYTLGYADEASQLAAGLTSVDLAATLRPVACRGSWRVNCYARALFLLDMLEEFGATHRVLWLDADTRVRRYPTELVDLDCDFAAYWRPPSTGGEPQLTGATMLLTDGPWIRQLMTDWWSRRETAIISQRSLHELLGEATELSVARLGPEYNFQSHHGGHVTDPVFEHAGLGSERVWGDKKWDA